VHACLDNDFDPVRVKSYLKTYETDDKYKGMEQYEWNTTQTRKDKEDLRQKEAARKEREREKREIQKVRAERRAEAEERKAEAEVRRKEREERQKERIAKKEALAAAAAEKEAAKIAEPVS